GGDRILLQHGADTVVLADLAEEVDRRERRRPVQVVDDASGVLAFETEVALDLRTKATDPFGHRLRSVEGALGGRARITDETGRAPDESQRLVSGQLDPAQREQLHEVAQMQTRSRRIEPAV